MRILILTKRQCVGRDILDDRYWRLFEIPEHLRDFGHVVSGLALSYRYRPEGICEFNEFTGTQWESLNAVPVVPYKLWRYHRRLLHLLSAFKPDLVWASSDAWHTIVAWLACVPAGIPYIIDLYDNYESFGLSKLPGVTPLLRKACRNADGLSLISHTLDAFVEANYALPPSLPRLVLGNAVNAAQFHLIDKAVARESLGLPKDAILVGTAGAIQANRGIETLIGAYARLASKIDNLHLILAGPKDNTLERHPHPGITYLGVLPPRKVPHFWNALDVAVVPNNDSTFGRYCYPQKLQEIIACGTPVVVSAVGEVNYLLRDYPECMAPPGSAEAMAERIFNQIERKISVDHNMVRTWNDRAAELAVFFEKVLARSLKKTPSTHQQ